MKKLLGIVFLAVIAVALVVFILFLSKSYYPPLPIEGLSKREAVKLLNDSDQDLVVLYDGDHYTWYGFKGNQLNGRKALFQETEQRKWIFQEQLGSGYIFQDDSNAMKIAESQMWTRKYVLYRIQHE